MKAAEEFTTSMHIAAIDGWFVAGASKRGWTTWLVGAVECATCPKIVGIAPLVPIVPKLHEEIHRMYQAYGGYTFAFKDYEDGLNLTAGETLKPEALNIHGREGGREEDGEGGRERKRTLLGCTGPPRRNGRNWIRQQPYQCLPTRNCSCLYDAVFMLTWLSN